MWLCDCSNRRRFRPKCNTDWHRQLRAYAYTCILTTPAQRRETHAHRHLYNSPIFRALPPSICPPLSRLRARYARAPFVLVGCWFNNHKVCIYCLWSRLVEREQSRAGRLQTHAGPTHAESWIPEFYFLCHRPNLARLVSLLRDLHRPDDFMNACLHHGHNRVKIMYAQA